MRWIKVDIRDTLRGKMRYQMTSEEQGIWFSLYCLAGDSKTLGVIEAAPGEPYPLKFIATQLRVPLKRLEQALKKFEQQGRIILNDGSIHIVDWDRDQYLSGERAPKIKGGE